MQRLAWTIVCPPCNNCGTHLAEWKKVTYRLCPDERTNVEQGRGGRFHCDGCCRVDCECERDGGDFEVWLPVEIRVPVVQSATANWPRVDWRMALEARFAGRYNGAEQIFLRTGPIVYVTPWFLIWVHGFKFMSMCRSLPVLRA
jgi:hypothetical protein